jgi:hypothetical protein
MSGDQRCLAGTRHVVHPVVYPMSRVSLDEAFSATSTVFYGY